MNKEIYSLNKNWPLITIGIPTYNGGAKIEKAVASVLDQNYPNLDIFISDNHSDLKTIDVCWKLMEKQPKVRYFRHFDNIGMLSNFEFLLKKASGKYFMWLADDDTLAPGVLFKYVEFMEKHPDYVLASGNIEYWLDGEIVEYERDLSFSNKSEFLRVISYYFEVIHGAMYHGLMKTEMAQKVGIRKVIGNDWHFVANLAYLGKVKNFEETGYRKAFGGSSNSFKRYAYLIGDTEFAAKYPHFKIALDAYKEVMSNSEIFSNINVFKRGALAVSSFLAIVLSHFFKIYIFIIGGKLKRLIRFPVKQKAYGLATKTNR